MITLVPKGSVASLILGGHHARAVTTAMTATRAMSWRTARPRAPVSRLVPRTGSRDSFIADLAVGTGCGHLRSGAPARGERVAKYNRLLEIAASTPGLRYGMPET